MNPLSRSWKKLYRRQPSSKQWLTAQIFLQSVSTHIWPQSWSIKPGLQSRDCPWQANTTRSPVKPWQRDLGELISLFCHTFRKCWTSVWGAADLWTLLASGTYIMSCHHMFGAWRPSEYPDRNMALLWDLFSCPTSHMWSTWSGQEQAAINKGT